MSHDPGSAAPLSVCLVSPISALDNGGTAAYIRHLGNHLSQQHSVRGVSRRVRSLPQTLAYEDSDTQEVVTVGGGWKTQIIAPHPVLRPVLRRVLSMITRPALQNLGVSVFQAAYDKAVDAAIPENVSVVHYVGTGWELMGFSALASARRRRAAFVITPFVHPGAWGDSFLDVRLYNAADAVFVCSQKEADYLTERGVRPEQFRKIGLAPASDFVGDGKRFREIEGLENRPLVLFIGRKQAYKGYHALRQAIQIVRDTIPDVCFAAAGNELEPPYPPVAPENFLDLGELKINPADQQRKADALAACDVFAMPSSAEAFGIVYVEAWAYGKPVLGGTAPAVRELVEQGITGLCVEQNDEAIAEALLQLLGDRELRLRMGAAGLARQQKEFTWQAVTAHHVALYEAARSKSARKQK